MESRNSINGISDGKNSKGTQDVMQEFCDTIQSEAYKPYTTDINFFDDLLGGGLIRGTLTILLAAPGAGKTALCAQLSEAIAEHGKQVLYLNFEMSQHQMLARSISSRATIKGVPTTALQVMQGYAWTEEQKKVIPETIAEYREKVYPFMRYRPDRVGTDFKEIRDYLQKVGDKAIAEGKEAPAVVVDYLHLITGGSDPQDTIKQTLFMLKDGYAAKYNTIVICIAAANRSSNDDGRISLTSGRDSSGIEYTADYQLGLNYYECEQPAKISIGNQKRENPDYVNPQDPVAMGMLQSKEVRRMVLRVLKGRFIAPGRSANLQFHAPTAHFYGERDFIPANVKQVPFSKEDYPQDDLI